jgi:hypothetical protein
MEEEAMNKIFKAGTTFAVAGLIVGGIAVGGASAGTSVQNVPGSTSVAAVTTAARVFAVVNANATLLRGKGVTSTAHLGPGVYDIRFARDISACAWTGTVGFGTFSASTGPAQITITGRSGTNNGLFVTTFNGAGVATDEPFAAVVLCS